MSYGKSNVASEKDSPAAPGASYAPTDCSAPYGFCPNCHAKGISRERRPHGNDKCVNGHTYPSDSAIVDRFIPSKKQMDDEWMEFSDELRKKYGEVGKAVFMHWCEKYGLPIKPNPAGELAANKTEENT